MRSCAWLRAPRAKIAGDRHHRLPTGALAMRGLAAAVNGGSLGQKRFNSCSGAGPADQRLFCFKKTFHSKSIRTDAVPVTLPGHGRPPHCSKRRRKCVALCRCAVLQKSATSFFFFRASRRNAWTNDLTKKLEKVGPFKPRLVESQGYSKPAQGVLHGRSRRYNASLSLQLAKLIRHAVAQRTRPRPESAHKMRETNPLLSFSPTQPPTLLSFRTWRLRS